MMFFLSDVNLKKYLFPTKLNVTDKIRFFQRANLAESTFITSLLPNSQAIIWTKWPSIHRYNILFIVSC